MAKLICLLNNHNPISPTSCFAALDYHPHWIRNIHLSGEVFLGCLELPFKNHDDFWVETEHHVLAVDGEILSWSEPLGKESQASRLLQLFRTYEEELVRHVNGNFTLLVWDKKNRTLSVMNDRMGLRPLYFSLYGGKICLASEMKAILSDPDFTKKINTAALVDLFTYEYIPGNDTLVNGIEVFPYASTARIHFGKKGLEPRRYWDFEYSSDIDSQTGELSEQYLTNFKDLLTQAVDRCIQGPYRLGLPLSGGLDSRMIGGVLAEINQKHSNELLIRSFTFGESNSDDVHLARKISKVIGSTHIYTGVKEDRLPEFFQKAVTYQDGLASCNHCHYFHMLDELEEKVQVALDGFVGDVLPRQMFRPYLGKEEEAIYSVYDTIKKESRLRVFGHGLEDEITKSRDRFHALWQQSLKQSPANPLDHFNLTHRQRKFINYGKISKRNHIEIRMPFTDYDLIDFCLKMPHDLRINDRICRDTFFRFFPRLAEIPQSEQGPFQTTRQNSRFHRRVVRLKEWLRLKGPLMDYPRYYRSSLAEFVRDTLRTPGFKSREYFNDQQVSKIVDEHLQGVANHKTLIGVLLTFELWYRFFLTGTMPDVAGIRPQAMREGDQTRKFVHQI